MLRVCIYKGYGMYEHDGKILFKLLSRYVSAKKYSVIYISPEDILSGVLNQKTSLFVIGGGFDLGIMKVLGSKGMSLIKDYVRNGGSYLGICCGAYFACDYIEFDKGGPLEVTGERFLKFYPGHSYGPLYKPYDYKTRTGAAASLITLQSVLKPDGHQYMSQDPVKSTRQKDKENVNREPGKDANLTMYSEDLFENQGISRQFKVYFNGGGLFVEKNDGSAMKTGQAEGYNLAPGLESHEGKTEGQGLKSQRSCNTVKGIESCDVDTTEQGVESQGVHTTIKRKESCDVDTTMQGVESQRGQATVMGIESLQSHRTCRQEEEQGNDLVQLGFENVTVIARYADLESKPAAIVKCVVDKGMAILSGVHFEYDAVDIDDGDPLVKDIIPELRNSAINRKYLMLLILRHLNISTQESL